MFDRGSSQTVMAFLPEGMKRVDTLRVFNLGREVVIESFARFGPIHSPAGGPTMAYEHFVMHSPREAGQSAACYRGKAILVIDDRRELISLFLLCHLVLTPIEDESKLHSSFHSIV